MQNKSGPPAVLIILRLILAGGSERKGVGGDRTGAAGAALFGVGAFLGGEGLDWMEAERGRPLPLCTGAPSDGVFGFLSG